MKPDFPTKQNDKGAMFLKLWRKTIFNQYMVKLKTKCEDRKIYTKTRYAKSSDMQISKKVYLLWILSLEAVIWGTFPQNKVKRGRARKPGMETGEWWRDISDDSCVTVVENNLSRPEPKASRRGVCPMGDKSQPWPVTHCTVVRGVLLSVSRLDELYWSVLRINAKDGWKDVRGIKRDPSWCPIISLKNRS